MYFDLRAFSRTSAALGFLLLFPGFALYHYFGASGAMPMFLGGLFGVVALAVATLCALLSFWLLRSHLWGGIVQAHVFLVFWGFVTAWTVIGYLSIASEVYAEPALREALSWLIIWLAVFFIGSLYPMQTNLQRRLLLAGALAVLAVFAHAMLTHGSLLGPLRVFAPGSELRVSTYQGVGRSIMVAAIVLSAMYSHSGKQLVVLGVAVVALLALGSRAHLFTTFAVLMATLFFGVLSAKRRGPIVAFSVLLAAGVWYGWSVFLETRASEILDLSMSTSWQGRLQVQTLALDVIRESPLLGEFGYHWREVGAGGYAHNALSAWTEFGLLGFVLFAAMILYFTALSAWKLLSPRTETALWRAAFGLNLASVILVLAAEPVFTAVPVLGWGFVVNALLQERRNHVVVRHA